MLTFTCGGAGQFQLHDANSDDAVNETESKQILDSIISVQKTVLTELFEKHVRPRQINMPLSLSHGLIDYLTTGQVANMPKKHMKLVAKGINEEDWKSKIPEKVRCVYHFADKVEDESEIDPPKDKTAKTVHWEIFRETQVCLCDHCLFPAYADFTSFAGSGASRAAQHAWRVCKGNSRLPVRVSRATTREAQHAEQGIGTSSCDRCGRLHRDARMT